MCYEEDFGLDTNCDRYHISDHESASGGSWDGCDSQSVGCDPEGLELQLDRTALRLPFPQRVRAPDALRDLLKQMAEEARRAA